MPEHADTPNANPGSEVENLRARIATLNSEVEAADLNAVFDAKTDPPKWAVSGHCVYNGDDMGSLVAECASFTIARIIMEQANKDPELRRRVADAK